MAEYQKIEPLKVPFVQEVLACEPNYADAHMALAAYEFTGCNFYEKRNPYSETELSRNSEDDSFWNDYK